jgi:excisionase family DNA binding protein
MKKQAFTTSQIAKICHHSRETVKRWLEKGDLKGYRVGTSGHWRVLPKDLAIFLKHNHIPFPDPLKVGIDLAAEADEAQRPTFCWEFHKNKIGEHLRSEGSCEKCLVYRVKSINCYALRKEVGHQKIHCAHSCETCAYLHFHREKILPEL